MNMCEETPGLLFQGDWARVAQLRRRSARPQLEGRLTATRADRACAQWPPAPASSGQERLSGEAEPTEDKACKNSGLWGFPKEEANSPWPLHSTTQPLSSAAEANSSQSAAHWLRAQSKGTSDSGELLRHERNKSKLREKRSPRDKYRKTTCTSHIIMHSETREYVWNPWNKNKMPFKDK